MNKRIVAGFMLAMLVVCSFFVNSDVKVSAASTPAKPVISVKSAKSNSAIKITIKKTTGADGFRIYMMAPGSKEYKKVKTLAKDGTATRSYTIKNLSEGTYKIKVRAYKKSGSKTVWSKYSKVASLKLSGDHGKDNNGSTGKQYGSFTVVKEYDVSHYNPYAGAKSTFDTVKLQEAFGSGEFSFKSGTHIAADKYSSIFASWLSEDSLFGEQDAFKFMTQEQIDGFNKLNVIPTISKTNTKGLTTETVLGTKEEATAILDAWLEARHADVINDLDNYYDGNGVYNNDYGVTSYYIDDEGRITFKSDKGSIGIWSNTEKFGEAVYTVGLWNTSDGQMDDVDIANQKLADIEILSLISKDPYDLVQKLYAGNKSTCLAYTIYDEWYRINDMLIYRDSSTGNMFFKPVS